ncbi:unnamed protein product [Rotaria sp. Silwood2]|nr:unnamed protein product [Rotaria sp. Silwood2]
MALYHGDISTRTRQKLDAQQKPGDKNVDSVAWGQIKSFDFVCTLIGLYDIYSILVEALLSVQQPSILSILEFDLDKSVHSIAADDFDADEDKMNNNESNTKIKHLQTIINNNESNFNGEDSEKTNNQTSITQNNTNNNNDQVITSQYDCTSELAESANASSKPTINDYNNNNNKSLTKTNRKSRKHVVQDHSSNGNDNENNRQRSLSSSSSTSSSSTSSSKSSDNQISNIPYETLHNDEDDDNNNDNLSEHSNKTINQISS